MKAGCCLFKSFDSVRFEKYVVHATLDEVARLTELLKSLMPKHLSEEDRYSVELGIAEVLTNIVLHGYAGKADGAITIVWEEQAACLRVSIVDSGFPVPANFLMNVTGDAFDFDPSDVQNLPQSGFGLALINAIFDVVTYERIENMNCMCLKKNF